MSLIIEPTILTVVQNPTTTVRVGSGNTISIPASSKAAVIVLPGPFQIITMGTQGPPGPPGTSTVLTAQAGTTIAAFKLLVMIHGLLYPADPTNPAHGPLVVGISLTAGISGDTIKYLINGEVDGMSSLSIGSRYYAGLAGSLSTTVQAIGATWVKPLGQARSATQFIFEPAPFVFL